MKIEVDGIKIDGTQFEAIVKVNGIFDDRSARWLDMTSQIEKVVVDQLAEEYLLDHAQDILKQVNTQSVVNAIVLRSADRLAGRQ